MQIVTLNYDGCEVEEADMSQTLRSRVRKEEKMLG